jgi:phosphoglycerol transferase
MSERRLAVSLFVPRRALSWFQAQARILAAGLLPAIASLLFAVHLRNQPLELPYSVQLGTQAPPLLGFRGFSTADSWGRWSQANEARIVLPRRLPRDFDLVLVTQGYGSNVGAVAEARVGELAATFTLSKGLEKRVLRFRNAAPAQTVSFRIPGLASPRERGEGDDPRRLGIGVAQLSVLEPTRGN